MNTDFQFAINLITDLASILLECTVNDDVDLHDMDKFDTPSRRIRITAIVNEHDAKDKMLSDFVKAPLSYNLHELV